MFNSASSVSILVAYTKKDRVIGAQGKIPWKLSSERNRFKRICNGKFILMGRKSFEEIGKALSYCTIIVISRTLLQVPQGCLLAKSIEEACKMIPEDQKKEILIAGGEEIYKQTIDYATEIYATEIDAEFEGTAHFPEIDDKIWKKIIEEHKDEAGIAFDYVTYKRISPSSKKTEEN